MAIKGGSDVVLVMLLFMTLAGPVSADDPPVEGESIIEIDSIEELQLIGNDPGYPLDGDYVLTQDIDASATADWNNRHGFKPIGRYDSANPLAAFTGTLDGQGHVIAGLFIYWPAQAAAGLLGCVGSSGEIRDLGLENGSIAGPGDVGGLVSQNYGGSVTGCYASGEVRGDGDSHYYVGGLIGRNSGGSVVEKCYATGAVSGRSENSGGLIGGNWATARSCYSTATVLTSTRLAGRLISLNWGTVENCYAMGAAPSGAVSGGLIGTNEGTVRSCYAMGAVDSMTGNDRGLVVINRGVVTASYWDIDTTGHLSSGGGKGLSSTQMKTIQYFQNAGWTNSDWVMTEGEYPRLVWEDTGAPPIPAPGPVPLDGSGTQEDPYRVDTPADFAALSWHVGVLDAHIAFTANLDCSGETLHPIGDLGSFSGVLDGGGHVVRYAAIEQPRNSLVGVFAALAPGGVIRNLGLEDLSVKGMDCVGGLVGTNSGGTVTGCYTTGTVSGQNYVSGLIGRGYDGSVMACYTLGTVSGDYYIGGLVGWNSGGTVTESYTTGDVSGYNSAGGLIGWISDGMVTECYAAGPVSAESGSVGGLIGSNGNSTVSDCFATGATSGGSKAGGLIGENIAGALSGCYATGAVSGAEGVGGLIGVSTNASVTKCYATGAASGTGRRADWGKKTGGLIGANSGGEVTACYANGNVSSSGGYTGGLIGTNSGKVTACYATGTATSMGNYVGGLAGWNTGRVTACYSTGVASGVDRIGGLIGHTPTNTVVTASFWDLNSSGLAHSDSGRGLSTLQMKTVLTFQNAGWAEYEWVMSEGEYPRLAWEGTGAPPLHPPEPVPLAGSGTEADPYRVQTAADFVALTRHVGVRDAHLLLTADIDCSGEALEPIGNFGPFSGVLDGGRHVIRNATIERPDDDFCGIFEALAAEGEIRNLGLENLSVSGRNHVAGLVSWNFGTITACHAIGAVSGVYHVGGLVGWNAGTVADSYTAGEISATETYAGGLAGSNSGSVLNSHVSGKIRSGDDFAGGFTAENNGILTACHAIGSVSGASNTGGLVGYNKNGTVAECSANVTVRCYSSGGGLAGANRGMLATSLAKGAVWSYYGVLGGLTGVNEGMIVSCYATGTVSTSDNYFAGLIGINSGSVTACYSTGTIPSDNVYDGYVEGKGLIDQNTGIVTTSFWDIETSRRLVSASGKGLSSAQMKDVTYFQNAGWSQYDWVMANGQYPRLAWEGTGAPPIPAPGPVPFAGSGTETDPYRIGSAIEFGLLSWYAAVLDKHILLTADLNCMGRTLYPLGDLGPFSGVLDGGGHVVRGVHIEQASGSSVGIVTRLAPGGLIRNLGIEGISVTGYSHVGGLVGTNVGTLTDCYVTGTVSGWSYPVGGLVGMNQGTLSGCYMTGTVSGGIYSYSIGGLAGENQGSLTRCHMTGTVSSYNSHLGGLVGTNSGAIALCHTFVAVHGDDSIGGLVGWNGGMVVTSYATGTIKGDSSVGGLVGWNDGTVVTSYATGTIKGDSSVGGLVGGNCGAVTASYATGTTTGVERVGGLVGSHRCGDLSTCYAVGAVSGDSKIGGLVGYRSDGQTKASYWDIESSGQAISAGGIGLPTSQMTTRATFEGAGWDFIDTWGIEEGFSYPYLLWQPFGAEGEGEGEGEGDLTAFHTADQNGDGHISLTELLRVLQFYNAGGFQCADNPGDTEDGFVPGPGENRGCSPHASDYNGGADWRIDLNELMRITQLYNLGGYRLCPGGESEDGFCPDHEVTGGEGEGEGEGPPPPMHTADQNGNGEIELLEFLRVLQFYNVGGLHCATVTGDTEDGFVPGYAGNRGCTPHASDYNGGPDWRIDLKELLRITQLHNSGACFPCPGKGTEDGFCPGLL